jgi:hypothetical protein
LLHDQRVARHVVQHIRPPALFGTGKSLAQALLDPAQLGRLASRRRAQRRPHGMFQRGTIRLDAARPLGAMHLQLVGQQHLAGRMDQDQRNADLHQPLELLGAPHGRGLVMRPGSDGDPVGQIAAEQLLPKPFAHGLARQVVAGHALEFLHALGGVAQFGQQDVVAKRRDTDGSRVGHVRVLVVFRGVD